VVDDALAADIITFTAASTVTNTVAALGPDQLSRLAAGPAVASIGPITSQAARDAGLTVTAEADDSDMAGLVRAILSLA
jgi:uroporphyrinogen III methyltransferase/synthase